MKGEKLLKKELKGCYKFFIKESNEITEDMLKFWNENLEYKVEEGEFKVFVGTNSENTKVEMFEYIEVV